MSKHEKKLLNPVWVERPNRNYAALLQEQLGGPQGELKSAMQYLAQSMRIQDPEIKDLFLDVAAEELCHLEMIATAVNLLNGHTPDALSTSVGNVEMQVLTGLTPMLTNASGYLWTAAYVNETGDAAADILSDIAAEQRAKVVYEYLYRQIFEFLFYGTNTETVSNRCVNIQCFVRFVPPFLLVPSLIRPHVVQTVS